ncbi:unnamed protein product [Cladocopium goreaui]|uniref:Methyltransferase domain-containing protein n=1 Tax=Cladocopium goreaui TaxID=2562237 RepID=A0A9P1BXT6_9DINO|nr:unnamed protein product [Cladocopium goreaui]
MLWLLLVIPALLLMILRLFAADVYDAVIVWMTARWYQVVFQRLQRGNRILDVGIGTATALVKNKAELLDRHLSVVGIDYEAAYVRKAEAVLKEADLWRPAPDGTEGYRPGEFYCRVLERSIYDEGLSELCYEASDKEKPKGAVPEDLRFDAVYFSGSLTVMPDPPSALKAVLPLMKRDGQIFITQTFQKKHSPLMAFIKPLMKYITTIDFGQLTTEDDLARIIAEADCFETVENEAISGSINNHLQTARLVILKAKPKAK